MDPYLPCVTIPLRGSYHMLQWYHWSQGGHLTLARTRKSLEHTLVRVLEEKVPGRTDTQILRAYNRIRMVGLTLEQRESCRRVRWAEEVDNFWCSLACSVIVYLEDQGKLPPGLVGCSEHPFTHQSPHDQQKCTQCSHGLVPEDGSTPEEWYRARVGRIPPHLSPERAERHSQPLPEELPDPALPVYAAMVQGYHPTEFALVELNSENEERIYTGEVAFYCQIETWEDLFALQELQKTAIDRIEAEQESRSGYRDEEHERERRASQRELEHLCDPSPI